MGKINFVLDLRFYKIRISAFPKHMEGQFKNETKSRKLKNRNGIL